MFAATSEPVYRAGPCMEGWTTLTALAQATGRLRLGTLVTGIHYRHPAVLAKSADLRRRQRGEADAAHRRPVRPALAIVYLPPPRDPRVLAPLAEALSELNR